MTGKTALSPIKMNMVALNSLHSEERNFGLMDMIVQTSPMLDI